MSFDFGQGLVEVGTQAYHNRQAAQEANEQAQFASAAAYGRTREMYENRYKWTMKDMRRAGLNPMLAATGGFSVGSTPAIASAQTFKADPINPNLGSGFQSAKTKAEKEKIEEETKTEQERQELVKNQAMSELAKAANQRAQAGLATTQEKETMQKVFNAEKEFERLKEATENVSLDNRLKEKAFEQLQVVVDTMYAEIEQIQKISEVYKNPGGQVLSYLKEISSILGLSTSTGYHKGTFKRTID